MIEQMREQDGGYTVAEMCESFGVSQSGYYARRSRGPAARDLEDERLRGLIGEIHADRHRECYGSPRPCASCAGRASGPRRSGSSG